MADNELSGGQNYNFYYWANLGSDYNLFWILNGFEEQSLSVRSYMHI